MNSKKYLTALIVFVALAGILIYKMPEKKDAAILTTIPSQEEAKRVKNIKPLAGGEHEELVKLDDEWARYTNKKLGFSIKVPHYSMCGDDLLELKSYEQENSIQLGSDCSFGWTDDTWAIKVYENIENEEELRELFRSKLEKQIGFPSCEIDKLTPDGHGGYDISNKVEPDAELGEGCFINWMGIFKWYPSKHKVITVDIGQDYTFYKENESGVGVDWEMLKSIEAL